MEVPTCIPPREARTRGARDEDGRVPISGHPVRRALRCLTRANQEAPAQHHSSNPVEASRTA